MGNNSWMNSAFVWRHLVPQNVGNIIFVCYFLNIGFGPNKVNGLAICSKNQFRDYFIRNRLEKLVPLNWNFAPQNFKTPKNKPTNLFSNLDFLVKSGFPKILDLSMDFPRISHPMDFPPHGFWIFGEAAGAADKNQDWTPRPNLQAVRKDACTVLTSQAKKT